eukprot:tig00020556_g11029.t1
MNKLSKGKKELPKDFDKTGSALFNLVHKEFKISPFDEIVLYRLKCGEKTEVIAGLGTKVEKQVAPGKFEWTYSRSPGTSYELPKGFQPLPSPVPTPPPTPSPYVPTPTPSPTPTRAPTIYSARRSFDLNLTVLARTHERARVGWDYDRALMTQDGVAIFRVFYRELDSNGVVLNERSFYKTVASRTAGPARVANSVVFDSAGTTRRPLLQTNIAELPYRYELLEANWDVKPACPLDHVSPPQPCLDVEYRDPKSWFGAACRANPEGRSYKSFGGTLASAEKFDLVNRTAALLRSSAEGAGKTLVSGIPVPLYDYIPTQGAGDLRYWQMTIRGLEPGIVYFFSVQTLVGPDDDGEYFSSNFTDALAVQSPGVLSTELDRIKSLQYNQPGFSFSIELAGCRSFRGYYEKIPFSKHIQKNEEWGGPFDRITLEVRNEFADGTFFYSYFNISASQNFTVELPAIWPKFESYQICGFGGRSDKCDTVRYRVLPDAFKPGPTRRIFNFEARNRAIALSGVQAAGEPVQITEEECGLPPEPESKPAPPPAPVTPPANNNPDPGPNPPAPTPTPAATEPQQSGGLGGCIKPSDPTMNQFDPLYPKCWKQADYTSCKFDGGRNTMMDSFDTATVWYNKAGYCDCVNGRINFDCNSECSAPTTPYGLSSSATKYTCEQWCNKPGIVAGTIYSHWCDRQGTPNAFVCSPCKSSRRSLLHAYEWSNGTAEVHKLPATGTADVDAADAAKPVARGRRLLDASQALSAPPPFVPEPLYNSTANVLEPLMDFAARDVPAPDGTESALAEAGAYAVASRFVLDVETTRLAMDNFTRQISEALSAAREEGFLKFKTAEPTGPDASSAITSPMLVRGIMNCYADLARPARLGRNQLGSLCPAAPPTTTGYCGVAVAQVAHFAFNATTSGVFRFSAAASGFDAVVGLVFAGSCASVGCHAPKTGVREFVPELSEISAFLVEGSSVVVTVAPFNGSCVDRPVALDVAADASYGLRLFVDPFLGSDSWPFLTTYGAASNVSIDSTGAPVRRYATLDAALSYAERRILAAGAAVEVGIFLMSGDYPQNGTTSRWSLPSSASAAGSRVYIRSISGRAAGPGSASDTRLYCTEDQGAFDIRHSSPLVVPLGITVGLCGGPDTPALSLSGGDAVTLQNVVFAYNNNTGAGGAVRVSGAATIHFKGCTFLSNAAGSSGGAVAISNGAHATFEHCNFVGNRALVGGAVLIDGAASASFADCFFNNNAAKVTGGAIAVLAISGLEPVRVANTTLEVNAAPQGAGIYAAALLAVSRCAFRRSYGEALLVNGTSATVDHSLFIMNFNNRTGLGGRGDGRSAGIICGGPSSSLAVNSTRFSANLGVFGGALWVQPECLATVERSQFDNNFGIVGGGALVGSPSGAKARGASFALCSFEGNGAGNLRSVKLPAGRGVGGGLAVVASEAPVRITDCLFAENNAYMGGGLFAMSRVEIAGNTFFQANVAGFQWHNGSDNQVGGGALFAAGAGGSSVARGVRFVKNRARGGFGGGLALVKAGEVALGGPVLVQNSVEGGNGQGAGLFVQGTRLAAGSTFRATANQAPGPYKNVYLADKVAEMKASGNWTGLGCAACSPCQLCNPDSGKCEFPTDLVDWCSTIGACNNETCPWVVVGSAAFGADMRSISVSFDVPVSVGAASSASSAALPCASLLDANSTASLGSAPKCTVQQASASSSRRSLAGAASSSALLIIQLGPGYTVEPGSPLYFQQSALPAAYQPLTGAGLVEVQQTGQTGEALRRALDAARTAGGLAPSQSGSTAVGAGNSGSGGLEGGHIAAIAIGAAAGVAVLVAAFFVAWRRLGRPVAASGSAAGASASASSAHAAQTGAAPGSVNPQGGFLVVQV